MDALFRGVGREHPAGEVQGKVLQSGIGQKEAESNLEREGFLNF